ncbi:MULTISPECIES: hypothetical protein [unclassified Microbacterium]|uniref:hypothetical protein n=1 Tax=unclassified Microbacterium TaxID=2609290 RepID=UPI00342B8B16
MIHLQQAKGTTDDISGYARSMYSFRVPLHVGNSNPDTVESRLSLSESNSESIWLQSNGPLADAERVAFCGSGYPTAEIAEQRANGLLPALRLTSLRTGIYFDFLSREVSGGMSETALRDLNEALPTGVRAARFRPGVMVHLTSEDIVVPRLSATVRAHTPAQAVGATFQRAMRCATASLHGSLAFDLYVASWRMPTDDARLLMLTSTTEAMVVPEKVSGEERIALRRLAAVVRADQTLSPASKKSLESRIGSLNQESIGSASARLADRLNPRTFLDRTARDFFSYAYDVRSRLVHGDVPPSSSEVALALGALGEFAQELIGLELSSLATAQPQPERKPATFRVDWSRHRSGGTPRGQARHQAEP